MKHYDVAILGGGISGLGVANACAGRGYSALVLEAQSLAHATSNNTLRIIHGGFRYLQSAHILRVVRSLNDQSFVATNFSNAVSPLPCLMPLKRHGLKSRLPVSAAAFTYGAIMRACRSPLEKPRIVSSSELRAIAPLIASLSPHGALCWHDLLMIDPHMIHATLASALTAKGCEIRERTKVISVSPTPRGYEVCTDDGHAIAATKVVNTLGPWLETIAVPQALRPWSSLQWCVGCNIIISKQLHPTHAFGIQSPDGRLFFCVPRGPRTAIGTWYTPVQNPAVTDTFTKVKIQQPNVPEVEIRAFIDSFNRALPEAGVTMDDVQTIDAGILPMKRATQRGALLYGAERIRSVQGYCEVVSTKYTTFRSQGENVARHLFR